MIGVIGVEQNVIQDEGCLANVFSWFTAWALIASCLVVSEGSSFLSGSPECGENTQDFRT